MPFTADVRSSGRRAADVEVVALGGLASESARIVTDEPRQPRAAREHAGDAENTTRDDGSGDAECCGDGARFEMAEQWTAHVADHLNARQPAAQRIGNGLVPHRHPEDAADAVGAAGDGEVRERRPQRTAEPE